MGIIQPLLHGARITEVDTTVVSPSTISTTEPILPGVEPNLHRPIFEVPVGADAATIQQVINSAAAQNGNRPIVHIPEGIYHIASTITIPANTDIQLVGDGNTTLQWTGTGSGPILYLPGPTKATLRDFQLDGGNRPYDPHFAAGIVVDNIDQPGSHVYLEQVLSAGGAQTNFLANGLDYTVIEAHDFSHLYQQSLPGSVGVKVVGGPLAAAGNPQTGSVNIYSGLSANEMLPWDVSGGGKLLVRDVWHEGSPSPAFLHLTGSGTLTMEGLMVAYSLINQSTPTFDINNFKGNATFINDYTSGNWVVSGDGTQAHVLGVGLNEITPTTTYFSNDASPAATVGLLQSMNASPNAGAIGGTAYPTPNTGTLDDAFLRDMFAQTRGAEPHLLTDLPAGVTDLRIFRVGVGSSGTDNIVFSAGTFVDTNHITMPAIAVQASMYGSVGTSAEVDMLVNQFLPSQAANAIEFGLNPMVYNSEALGLAFAFGNGTGSTAFANNFGPTNASLPNTTAGDAAFSLAAVNAIFGSAESTDLSSAMSGWVTSWKALFTANGIPGIHTASADQIDLAARAVAWGDAVGLALDNNLGPLREQTLNFLMDAADGIANYSMPLVGQPAHDPFGTV